MNCATCHDDLTKFTRRQVDKVKFPSGAVLDIGNKDANLCLECHQGREVYGQHERRDQEFGPDGRPGRHQGQAAQLPQPALLCGGRHDHGQRVRMARTSTPTRSTTAARCTPSR